MNYWFVSNLLVSATKSSTPKASALRLNTSSLVSMSSRKSGLRAFLSVLRLWLKAVFTTCLKSASSQPKSLLELRTSRITADFTFGGGQNAAHVHDRPLLCQRGEDLPAVGVKAPVVQMGVRVKIHPQTSLSLR